MRGDYLMPVCPVVGSGSPSWYTYVMAHAIRVRGRLSDPRHIELDEPVNDLTGSVEVVVQQAQPRPLAAPRALFGLCADLGTAPSAEEIDDARREMWSAFPRDDVS
jgi:hypothetical protein